MSDDASFVGSIPQYYDQGLGPVIFVDCAADMARRAVATKPSRVLEIAAGTGIVTRALRDALPGDVQLMATDLNPPMLEIARTKFKTGERVDFAAADAMALPFPDNSFNTLVCQFGAMFFPDKDLAYREALRVLTPGGTYLLNVWDGHANNAFGRITHETVGRFFPTDPPQFHRLPFSYPFEPIKDSLVAAGFVDITAFVFRHEKDIPDPKRFAQGLVMGNPLIDQIRSRGGVDPELVIDGLVEAFGKEFGIKPMRMTLQALVFSAKKPA